MDIKKIQFIVDSVYEEWNSVFGVSKETQWLCLENFVELATEYLKMKTEHMKCQDKSLVIVSEQ